MSVEDVALVCVAVALGGVWWQLVEWGGAVAGLVIDLEGGEQ